MSLRSFLASLCKNARGTSSVELGLICALIVLAMLGALKGFAEQSISMWDNVNTKSANAVANGAS